MDDIIVTSIIPFFQPVEQNNKKDAFVYKEFNLFVILGGDKLFLHVVCGLQSCVATNFCIHRVSNLDRLRTQGESKIRTRETAIIQLEKIHTGEMKAK
jgi:hypothetical protein